MFINREAELQELAELADRSEPALALVYGRRRVGKTYLLDRAWTGRRVLYYLAADSTAAVNQRELLQSAERLAGRAVDPADYPTWRSVLRFVLLELGAGEPLIVVLDEFQYLLGGEDDIASQLVAVWDREVSGRRILLVLCGSEVGTMERLQAGDSPLYGRINWSARIGPFDYFDAGRMVEQGRGVRERAYVYGVLGGTPRFLSVVRPGAELGAVVRDAVLSPRGEVHLQLATLIQQEKGIREPREYQAVLSAVATGRTETNEIATAAGLQERPHVVRRALDVLESLGLVRRERNFDASERTPWRFRLADNAVRFWYRFVHPHRSRLERGGVDSVWRAEVAPRLDDYMGRYVFEPMAADAYGRHHAKWGLPPAALWARWEGRDRNRQSIELDIVAEMEDGRILTGEVKWSSQPVDTEVHYRLQRDLEALAHSGHGWARDAVHANRSAGHIYISAAGFTDHFRERAHREPHIRLIDLDVLYAV
ncbi:ATP-binding protein [Piscinibacter sp.]|uniref:ATP-binding protein n=1 Tax=Piscinibacter sp. TaxID=1903157 RepID=UPI002C8F9606|nr:ATP-binding protein [Albitalea sp.]HUG26111.1 ATP-binding protein [Albitalea sp.]